ncbi:MAG: hypothetical protein FWF51_09500 [Chitinivibrionia bacterium]|nr:hypothetical protein [Chitinivibrionia bacterium]
MESAGVIKLIWVVIFFFSVIILFFVWAKSVVITRLFVRVRELLHKMDTLYDDVDAKEDEHEEKDKSKK